MVWGLLLRPFLPPPPTTVIIPTYNESANIKRTVHNALCNAVRRVEVIVADGKSTDDTFEEAYKAGARVIQVTGGRAAQMNAAAKRARGRTLLFLHADTKVPPEYDTEMRRVLEDGSPVAGTFRLGVKSKVSGMKLICAVANWRASFLQTPYGDQGLFMTRARFREIGGYPRMDFLDDYEMVRKLRAVGRIHMSSKAVETSDRRWKTLGVVRTTLMNQCIIAGYHLGVPVHVLRDWYRNSLRKRQRQLHEKVYSQTR